ncbi:MAG TPA: hypothetical protein VGQ76_15175 [Thermoanaerobaculia bacterium]|nr:hypothetical protein [Thermoanaerobaculia bacterium]
MVKFSSTCLLLLLLVGCASSTANIDMTEPRRIVGTENAVRVDARISGDHVSPGAHIPITYDITNQRATPIAVAELNPETSYDAESHMFTVSIGSEVPGNTLLPRLIAIGPGETKSFTTSARVIYVMPPRQADPQFASAPAEFRLKLNFLGDTEPFRELIGIKENAVANAKLADQLFPLWLERNEVVYTNTIPMRWGARRNDAGDAQDRSRAPRRRGSP